MIFRVIFNSFGLLIAFGLTTFSQTPQAIPYQAVARNAAGVPLSNQNIKVRFSIRDSILSGTIVYREMNSATTNSLGLFNLNVGLGTPVTGTFSGINWGKNSKFLQVEMDPAGGNSFTDLGTEQMMSVPYALYSGNGIPSNAPYGSFNLYNCDGKIQFTPCLPIIETTPILNITSFSGTCGGNIINDGGSPISARGVCWSINPNPTTEDSITNDGSGNGSFSSFLTGLVSGQTYYFRAYAINGAGTRYGNQHQFTTSSLIASPVTDVDGNVYQTVAIGNQIWMKENLKVSKFRNLDPITPLLDSLQWTSYGNQTGQEGWCYYKDNSAYNSIYGKLYNWYAVTDPRGLCPSGWHVPTDGEWYTMENFLDPTVNDPDALYGRGTVIGGKLKAVSSLWTLPNSEATNSSGFTALPGGVRCEGIFFRLRDDGFWWTSTVVGAFQAWIRNLNYLSVESNKDGNYGFMHDGFSVRCIKD